MIRHGEVAAELVGTFVGVTDVALSDVGRHQAAAISTFMQDVGLDAVLTSPRARARDTAQPLLEASGLPGTVREGFAEMNFGEWEGLHWPEIEAHDPEYAARWQADPANVPCPGGDTASEFADGVQAELHAVLDEFRGRNVALFAHAGVNRAIMADVLGIPYMQSFAISQDYGCINAAGWDGSLAQIALTNLVPGPRSAIQGDGNRVGED
jgi:broad specificity phosphatase PhoE